jgi:hypothetical protein
LCFGTSAPTCAEAAIEVLERLLEPDGIGIELAHRGRQPVLGEVVWIDAACLRDQLHCAHRRPVVPVGQHVDVRVRHPLPVHLTRCLRQAAVGEAALVHQPAQGLSEWLAAWITHTHF